ncbi:hypothetical protein [Qipengyuania sp. SM2507]
MVHSLIAVLLSLQPLITAIPDPETLPPEQLGEVVLSSRNEHPIMAFEIQSPRGMNRQTSLFLYERPVPSRAHCMRTQWRAAINPAGEIGGQAAWWVGSLKSDLQLALISPDGECPATNYVTLVGAHESDLEVIAWALERYNAFLDVSESFAPNCTGQGRMQEICSSSTGLRDWLNTKVVQSAIVGDGSVTLRLDRTTIVGFSTENPGAMAISIRPPVPF